MKYTPLHRAAAGLCLLAALSLTGCASHKPLYEWNGYQSHVYNYLRPQSGSPAEQILALEKGVQTTAAQGAKLPPGYMAHLGLLYLNEGRTQQAAQAWQQEKTQFPESAPYIDYLLNNMKKGG